MCGVDAIQTSPRSRRRQSGGSGSCSARANRGAGWEGRRTRGVPVTSRWKRTRTSTGRRGFGGDACGEVRRRGTASRPMRETRAGTSSTPRGGAGGGREASLAGERVRPAVRGSGGGRSGAAGEGGACHRGPTLPLR